MVGYVVPTEFFQPFSSQREFFLRSLKNMSVSFKVKDQSQAASHNPLYSGVAEAAVQPAVGVRGGVKMWHFDFVATFWKISSDLYIYKKTVMLYILTDVPFGLQIMFLKVISY